MAQTRDKEATRCRILEAAFAEFHRSGFQSADLDAVADEAGVTRGTLYYHFGSKEAMAQHVVREVALSAWTGPLPEDLAATDDPISVLRKSVLERPKAMGDAVLMGCPINNLTQEMATRSEVLRQELLRLYSDVETHLVAALERGQAKGTVRRDVDPRRVALFFLAAAQGMMGLTKAYQDTEMPTLVGGVLVDYLETLRPRARAVKARGRATTKRRR